MDLNADDTQMLSSALDIEAGSILIEHAHWRVREMLFDSEKIKWLWDEMQKYPTLFSDLTRGNVEVYKALIQNPYSYWLEVLSEDDQTLGILYVTDLYRMIDANVHLIFFDRRAVEKTELVKDMLRLVFDKFPSLHRITAVVPSIYHATIRLAKRVGFKQEGIKRQSQLIRHEWCDEFILGLLAGDLNG